MKTRLKHLLAAMIPYWIVQAVVLVSGYTDGSVVLRVYLPVFVVSAAALLLGQFWAGHGIWLSAAAGLMAEWLMRGGKSNTGGIILNMVILAAGIALSILLQVAVNKRKKKKLENA